MAIKNNPATIVLCPYVLMNAGKHAAIAKKISFKNMGVMFTKIQKVPSRINKININVKTQNMYMLTTF